MPDQSATMTDDLIRFLDAAPTPYHAVSEVVRRLSANGYRELDEREEWTFRPGDRRLVVKGGGTVVALHAGSDTVARAGYRIVGAHTDSPNFRLKPRPDVQCEGYGQIGVEVYGSVLLATWMDRDLSVAGRVSLSDGSSRLVNLRRPICRMPSLAVHLNRRVNKDGLVLNPQKHTVPILSVSGSGRGILDLVAQQLDVEPDDVRSFDLCLYDVQGAVVGGERDDLLFSARVDNLVSCYAALEALSTAGEPGAATRVLAFYDHEEVGSRSSTGAQSRFLSSILRRVADGRGEPAQAADRALARSLLVSTDMAHAVHPNYADKHDKEHQPRLGAGPVLKINAGQSYATDGPAAALFDAACSAEGFVAQRFASRADVPCGGTIGPISAARLGIRTVDVGNPMLSMHSCRETCTLEDVPRLAAVLRTLLRADVVPAPSA